MRKKEYFYLAVVVVAVGMMLSYCFLGSSLAPLLLLVSVGGRTQPLRKVWNFVVDSGSHSPHDNGVNMSNTVPMSSGIPAVVIRQHQPQQQQQQALHQHTKNDHEKLIWNRSTTHTRRRRIQTDTKNRQDREDDSNDEDDGQDILDGINKFFDTVIAIINMILPIIFSLLGLGGTPADKSPTDELP